MSTVTVAASNPETALLTGADYVPSPMDTSMLTSQLVVLGFTGVMVAYWWYVLVPGARVNLAVNKKSGKLRDYLEELKDDDSRAVERFFYQKWLAKVDPETRFLLREDGSTEGGEGDQMERGTNVKRQDGHEASGHRGRRDEGGGRIARGRHTKGEEYAQVLERG